MHGWISAFQGGVSSMELDANLFTECILPLRGMRFSQKFCWRFRSSGMTPWLLWSIYQRS